MRIVIVDDHPVVRYGVEQTLSSENDFKVVGIAASCQEGIQVIENKKPDIAIVDMKMPDGSGIELIIQSRKLSAQCRFIILTSYASPIEISQAVSNNVEGYILKEALPDELIAAVKLVARGRRYYDPEIIDSVMTKREENPFEELTNREIDILNALASGLNNKSIANKLFISENTVKKHICNLLDKLNFQDRTQAALFAFSHGLGKEYWTDQAN